MRFNFCAPLFCVIVICSCEPLDSSASFSNSSNDASCFNYSTKSPQPFDFSVSLMEAESFVRTNFPDRKYSVLPLKEEKDTLLFVFNFQDEGWTIIAGDKRMQPILGVNNTGSISEDSNEELLCWLNEYLLDVKDFKENCLVVENENTLLWARLCKSERKQSAPARSVEYKWGVFKLTHLDSISYVDVVPHLITTKWGQSYDYDSHRTWNYKCPFHKRVTINRYCPTGCNSVAISQMLYFTHYSIGKPNGLYHSITVSKDTISVKTSNIGFSRGDYHPNSSRWDLMATHFYEPHTDYVGDLMMDVGNRLGMSYSGTGSSSSISLSPFSYYGLSGSTGSYNSSIVNNSLISGSPVIVRASNGNSAHSWIIDGIANATHYYTERCTFEYSENWMYANEYYDTFDELRIVYHINDPNEPLYLPYTASMQYFLMNWGWDGVDDDGYYSMPNGSSWNGFQSGKEIYYGFH